MKHFWMLTSCSILLAGAAFAQDVNHFTFNLGVGFTEPIQATGTRTDIGWNARAGVGGDFNAYSGLMLNFDYNDMGINRGTLNSLGFPNGGMRIWSVTLDPVIHLTQHHAVDFYITGGGGLYHRTIEFTQPTVGTFTGFDPYFGYFYRVAVPANQVIASNSIYKPGWEGGAGIGFGGYRNAKFFVEAKYHRMIINEGNQTEYIPVTFGVRW